MKKLSIGNHLTPYLLGACILLTVILALESYSMVQIQDNTSPEAQPAVAQVTMDDFTAPGIAAFGEVTERPLFREGREPPPEPKTTPVAAAKLSPLQLHLEGVAITPSAKIAVVRDLSSNKMLHLAKGMKHQGWELTTITSTGATFRNGEHTHELKLNAEDHTRKR